VQFEKLKGVVRPDIQAFIRENADADERDLILQRPDIGGVPTALVAMQIAGRRRAKSKLPSFYSTPNLIYPPSLNLQQSSSEATAEYKAENARKLAAKSGTLVDLTGGFGVDAYFFSRKFSQVIYVEPDLLILDIARHNHHLLGTKNIEYFNGTAQDFLAQWTGQADLIFVDPSRRPDGNQKVHRLADCEPNVATLQNDIMKRSPVLMVKASPLLDIRAALRELKHTTVVAVVAVDNDCKELLFAVESVEHQDPDIHAVNLESGGAQSFLFRFSEESAASSSYSLPGRYIYEPNVAILKAGAFKLVGILHGLAKLDANSHLYTADEIVMDFPGRIFRVDRILSANPRAIATAFPEKKANILVRNYPLSVSEIRKKLKIAEGGEKFLLGTSSMGKRFLLESTRLA
jgi:16S rRNA G966 N2-methylase RsmD